MLKLIRKRSLLPRLRWFSTETDLEKDFTPDKYQGSKARLDLPAFEYNKVKINFPWLIRGVPSLPI